VRLLDVQPIDAGARHVWVMWPTESQMAKTMAAELSAPGFMAFEVVVARRERGEDRK
jgi:hypothetical protein